MEERKREKRGSITGISISTTAPTDHPVNVFVEFTNAKLATIDTFEKCIPKIIKKNST